MPQLVVKVVSNGIYFKFNFTDSTTLLDLKKKIEDYHMFHSDNAYYIVFVGTILMDESATLSSLGIENMSTIFIGSILSGGL